MQISPVALQRLPTGWCHCQVLTSCHWFISLERMCFKSDLAACIPGQVCSEGTPVCWGAPWPYSYRNLLPDALLSSSLASWAVMGTKCRIKVWFWEGLVSAVMFYRRGFSGFISWFVIPRSDLAVNHNGQGRLVREFMVKEVGCGA